VVVGKIQRTEALDAQGWKAELAVERVLAGDAAPGETLRIAWEELARRRTTRFSPGDRVAVALEPLPSYSLWRRRFADGDALLVAARGEAFLRDPDPATLDLLGAYLELPSAQRKGGPGADALAALVAGAAGRLAAAALARLDSAPGLAAKLGDAGSAALARALGSADRHPALRQSIFELAARRHLVALRPAVEAQAHEGAPLEAVAWATLGALDGGLPAERVAALLARSEPALRAVGVHYARGTPSEAAVEKLVTDDPTGLVRAEAAESWIRWRGIEGLSAVEPALFDADRRARGRVAQAVGRLGAPAVPRLAELLDSHSGEQAVGPLAALRFAGNEGLAALKRASVSHPDENVRMAAKLALGERLPER
jgi:hypothetical protein